MIKRQTWVLFFVFVAFIGLAFVWTGIQQNRKKTQATSTPTPQQNLFTFESASVANFSIVDNSTGKGIKIARDESGQWMLTEPETDDTDVASVEAAVTQLASLRVLTVLGSVENVAEYGLDQPAYTITVNQNGGQQYLAHVGSLTVTSSGYYMLVPGDSPKIVAKYGVDAVLKLLQNPPIATSTLLPTAVLETPTP